MAAQLTRGIASKRDVRGALHTLTMSRKHKQPAKKRTHALYAKTRGVVDRISIVADALTGAIEIVQADPASYRSVIYHQRASGKDKVLLDAPATSTVNAFDAHAQLVATFRYVLAVDTNRLADDCFAVACVFAVPTPLATGAQTLRAEFLNAFVIVDPSPGVNVERIGWHLTIRQNILPGRFGSEDRIALVTDSELGDLPRINARTIPYYNEHTLPENVSLLYASADKPTDTIPSALIRACDAHATALAGAARAHRDVDLQPGDSSFRGWYCMAPDQSQNSR